MPSRQETETVESVVHAPVVENDWRGIVGRTGSKGQSHLPKIRAGASGQSDTGTARRQHYFTSEELHVIIYAMALPERYDIASGAYAFTLVLTPAISGESSAFVLASRAWETLIGGALGLATALVVLPLRTYGECSASNVQVKNYS